MSLDDHQKVLSLFDDRQKEYGFLIDEFVFNKYYQKNVKVFGEFVQGELSSILVNNGQNITYYANDKRDVTVYEDILSSLTFSKVSGEFDLIDPFLKMVQIKSDVLSHLGHIVKINHKPQHANLELCTISTKQEFSQLYDLLHITDEFTNVLSTDKDSYVSNQYHLINEHESTTRICYLEINGQMIATAQTVSEYKNSVIITGVYTSPHHRDKGYGMDLLIRLCSQLLIEGKTPYFFYNNPKARSIYLKIGVLETTNWRVLHK